MTIGEKNHKTHKNRTKKKITPNTRVPPHQRSTRTEKKEKRTNNNKKNEQIHRINT